MEKFYRDSQSKLCTIYAKMPLYEDLMELIGYAHDLGKCSSLFQKMLKDEEENKDVFRHEIYSYYILKYIVDSKKQAIKNINSNEIKKNITNDNQDENFLINISVDNKDLFKLIYQVILSHHKIPLKRDTNQNKYIFSTFYKKENMKNNFKKISFSLEENILKHISKLIEKVKDKNISLNYQNFVYFRLALMLSDHYISSLVDNGNTNVNNDKKLLAKSKKYGSETLENHLYSVSKMCRYTIKNITKIKNRLVNLSYEEVKEAVKPSRDKFIWQNKVTKILKEEIKKHNTNSNFIILGAKTGAGKTKTALRLMSEINKKSGLRLNVVLGLRTLTTQTGKAYKDILNIDNSMIATIIGSDDLEEKEKDILTDDYSEDELIDIENGFIDNNIPKYIINQARTDKQKRLISTPIVISTIDYMIKATDFSRSKFLLPQLRLMSSDIIIDEIDMYNKTDLLHILKLIYLAGLFNRNVIITTATILPSIATASYELYKKGFNDFKEYSGFEGDINSFYFSDVYNIVKTNEKEFYNEALKEHAKKIKVNNYHKAKIIEIDEKLSNLYKYIEEIHKKNSVIYKAKDKDIKVSIGLIKINTIKNGYKVLKTIQEQSHIFNQNKIKINIVFYHSRLLKAIRLYTEKLLDEALGKRGGKTDNFLSSTLFKNGLSKIKDETDMITIVIATEVEEVGRDHDFDWGIIEPYSSRSIIQSMGRINRHRQKNVKDRDINNIYILNENLSKKYLNSVCKGKTIKEIYGEIENDTSSSSVIATKSEFSKNENLVYSEFIVKKMMYVMKNEEKFYTAKDIETKWRSGAKQSKYVYDIEENKIKTIKEENNTIVDSNLHINILNNSENHKNYFIDDNNFNQIIDDMRNHYEISDKEQFAKKLLVTSYYKDQKANFDKILGIV